MNSRAGFREVLRTGAMRYSRRPGAFFAHAFPLAREAVDRRRLPAIEQFDQARPVIAHGSTMSALP